LRRSRPGILRDGVDPKWSGFVPWQAAERDHSPSGKSPPPPKASR
jgi:hypothetical protein